MIRYFKRKVARAIVDLIWSEITKCAKKRDTNPNFRSIYQHKIIALSDIRETIAEEYKIDLN